MNSLAAALGTAVDQAIGEPPFAWHPVARYGSLMQRIERGLYEPRRRNGFVFTAVGAGIGITAGVGLRRLLGATTATIVATAVCAAGNMLDGEAMKVSGLLSNGDIDAARLQVRSLVGRTTEHLEVDEISRAVVESVAENCVDAITSSIFWSAVGGAPTVLAHRAINTLDAMVGHHNDRYERFGWASARLDDVINYVPARLTALAVGCVRPTRSLEVIRTVRRDAGKHPSPNGGVIEAAFAAALDVRLGGVNTYGGTVEDRGTLGDACRPTPADIARAVRLRRDTTAMFAVLLVAADALTRNARKWRSGGR